MNNCNCIDCGGTEPGHSNDCTYMHELHGANEPTDPIIVFEDGSMAFKRDCDPLTLETYDWRLATDAEVAEYAEEDVPPFTEYMER